jgi:predicted proteasome-type protease
LYSVSDELEDPEEIDDRADLLIAVENLIDVALHVTDSVRRIAWQDSNEHEETESDYD